MRKTRAAILPFPGDPFLLNYWLHFFDTVWGDEIDKLYIYLNSPIEPVVIDYIRNLCTSRPKINLQYLDHMGDHGPAITRSLEIVEEELVMLVEDDGFIFKKGIVDWCFQQIEGGQYDIVAGKRGSCAMEILNRAKEIWGLDYEGEGDQGPNFWPCFFFSSKQTLMDTDRNFAAKAWKKGEVIHELDDYVVQDDVIYGDTFVNTSLQLRAKIPQSRILCIPQYHGSPDDIEHAQRGKYLFDGQAPWTHIGSLSSGISGVLRDGQNRALDRRLIDEPKGETMLPREWCRTDAEKNEWERRVQWWSTFSDFARSDLPAEMVEFHELYCRAVLQIIQQYHLRLDNIQHRQRIYKDMLGL